MWPIGAYISHWSLAPLCLQNCICFGGINACGPNELCSWHELSLSSCLNTFAVNHSIERFCSSFILPTGGACTFCQPIMKARQLHRQGPPLLGRVSRISNDQDDGQGMASARIICRSLLVHCTSPNWLASAISSSHLSHPQSAGDSDNHSKFRSATHKRRDSLDSELVSSHSMPSAALDSAYASVEADSHESSNFG